MGPRIVICGGPKTGKTTLAGKVAHRIRAREVRHTDELIGVLPWSEDSEEVARWFSIPGPWIVEGVAAVRALRKWLASHPEGAPCDLVCWLSEPKVPRTPGQERLAKGTATVWAGTEQGLRNRGVIIVENGEL
jgi:hypothetical protein